MKHFCSRLSCKSRRSRDRFPPENLLIFPPPPSPVETCPRYSMKLDISSGVAFNRRNWNRSDVIISWRSREKAGNWLAAKRHEPQLPSHPFVSFFFFFFFFQIIPTGTDWWSLAAFVVIFDDDPSGLIYGRRTRVFRFLFNNTRPVRPVLSVCLLACRLFDVCIGDFVGGKIKGQVAVEKNVYLVGEEKMCGG